MLGETPSQDRRAPSSPNLRAFPRHNGRRFPRPAGERARVRGIKKELFRFIPLTLTVEAVFWEIYPTSTLPVPRSRSSTRRRPQNRMPQRSTRVSCLKVRFDHRQMRGLPVHPPLDPGIHNPGIGQDETHLLAIAPEEQIGVPLDP